MSYLGEDIKKLGFGLMRLPQKDNGIDVEQVKEMVDLFLEAGFTYFDTPGVRTLSARRWWNAIQENAISSPPRMPRGSTAGQKRRPTRSSIRLLHRPGRDILISICSIIWARTVLTILTILTCGTGYRRKRKQAL